MSAKHTPGLLAQGRTLRTRVTERWTKEECDLNEAREKCLVFTYFTPIDQGAGRKLVAQCHQGPEDARRLVACWNACDGVSTEYLENKANARLIAAAPELLDQLRFAVALLKPIFGQTPQVESMETAIAKAIG